MPSQGERARWERAWEQMLARMERQRDALTRLVLVNTETIAALAEIAEIDKESHRVHEWEGAAGRASARAREALERIGAAAAAAEESVEELDHEEVPDPRKRPR